MADNKVNEAAGNLTESLRETNQAIVESTVEAQKRNLAFAQNTFENGIELLKSHADSTRNLISELAEQSQKQQESFQALVRESWDTYVDLLFTPFSYYRQAVDTAESIARQGVHTAENISRQGMQAAQRGARQGQNAAESATK